MGVPVKERSVNMSSRPMRGAANAPSEPDGCQGQRNLRKVVLHKIVETFNIKPWVEVYSYHGYSVFVTPLILSSRHFQNGNIQMGL